MDFPEMVLIKQQIEAPRVADVGATVSSELARIQLPRRVHAGTSIAITVGSRGIANVGAIVGTIVQECKKLGAAPFVVPAMGSHGGATAEGQRLVLESIGVTEETVGCPIVASMDVVQIGETPEGIRVVIDKAAAEADGIILFNRVKEHTDYRGDLGSGLMKMMVIGLGKYEGAFAYHKHAYDLSYHTVITSVARMVLKKAHILFGVATLENPYNETADIVAVEPEKLEETEKKLLVQAKRLSLKLPFEDLDILVVDELGKEISGTGIDTNVIGRSDVPSEPPPTKPRIVRIVVRDLTEQTHGNAVGVGLADYVTRRLADKVDFRDTYINAIAGMTPQQGRLPVVAETDREAIQWALDTVGARGPKQARVVWIKNTASLDRIYVSSALLSEVQRHPNVSVAGRPQEMTFDGAGFLLGGFSSTEVTQS